MEAKEPQAETLIRRSVMAYRCLLNIYPPAFRREYAEPMAQLFRDQCCQAYQQVGSTGLVEQWAEAIPDLLGTAFAEHARERSVWNMLGSKFFSAGGVWALLAGVLWMLGSIIPRATPVWFISTFVLLPAVINLHRLSRTNAMKWSRTPLLFAVIGVLVLMFDLGLLVIVVGPDDDLPAFFIWALVAGASMLAVGLVMFGLRMLRQRTLPRGNWLPIGLGVALVGQVASLLYVVLFVWTSPVPSIGGGYLYFPFAILFGLGWIGIAIAPFYERNDNISSASV